MGYIERNLMEGEWIVVKAHCHYIDSTWKVLGILAAFLWVFYSESISISMSIIYFFAPFILFFMGLIYLLHVMTLFAVTNRRIVARWFDRRRHDVKLDLDKLQDVNIDQGDWGRKMGYGTIILTCIDGSKVSLPDVADPVQFQQKIVEQIAQIKRGSFSEIQGSLPV